MIIMSHSVTCVGTGLLWQGPGESLFYDFFLMKRIFLVRMASLGFIMFNVVDDLFGRPILLAGIIMDLLPDLKICENNHETTNRVQ